MRESLSETEIEKEIITWIKDVIEAQNTILNSYPICPFAKQARLSNQIEICVNRSPSLPSFIKSTILKRSNSVKVQLIVETALEQWTIETVDKLVSQINADIAGDDLVLLYDHPADPGAIGDVSTSNGKYLIIFAQSASELEKAHTVMKATRYYSTWTAAYYQKIVEAREKLHRTKSDKP